MSKNAIAFLAGLGSGYLKQSQLQDEQARQDEDRRMKREKHDADMQEVADRRRKDKALADAGATVAVNEDAATLDTSGKTTVYDNADVAGSDYRQARQMQEQTGAPVTAEAPKKVFAAAGLPYDTKAGAQAAADTANAPEARRARQIAALDGIGKPLEAQQLQSAVTTNKAQAMQLSQAEEGAARDKMFRETATLIARGGWGSIPELYKRYDDGKDAKVIEDGKGGATVIQIDADGKELGKVVFPDLQQFMISQLPRLDPKLWLSETDKAAGRAETARHNRATEKNAADKTAASIEIAAARLDAATARRAAQAAANADPGKVTAKDLEDANKVITARFTEIFQPKEGMGPEERAGLGAQRDKAASEAHGIWRINNTSGNVIDTGTAVNAARLAADPKALLQRQATDGNTYPGVMVNGQFVVTGPPLMKKPAKPPAAAAAPAPKPLPIAAAGLPRTLGAVPGAADENVQRLQAGIMR